MAVDFSGEMHPLQKGEYPGGGAGDKGVNPAQLTGYLPQQEKKESQGKAVL